MSTKRLAAILLISSLCLCIAAVTAISDGSGAANPADAAGGRWAVPQSVWPAAVTAPTVAITTPSATGWKVDSASFTFSGTAAPGSGGALTGVQYKLNSATVYSTATDDSGGAWTAWHVDVTLVAGSNTISVKAVSGTTSSSVVTRSITYTPPAPAPVITSPANGAIISASGAVAIKGTAGKSTGGQSISSVQLTINGTPVTASGTSTWSYNLTATSGTYTVTARSVITATPSNLYSPYSNPVTFVYAPPPTAAITNPPATGGATDLSPFTFTGTASPAISALAPGVPAVSKVQYQLNSTTGAWTDASVSGDANNWSAPVTLKAGSNTFYVRAVAGTVTGSTVSTALTYSPPTPAPVITAPADGGWVSSASSTVSITGTAGKSTGGLAVTSVKVGLRVSGSASDWTWYTASGTSSWSYKATLSPGSYDVTAQSFIHKLASMPDLASPLATIHTFVYAPLPTVTITNPPATGGATDQSAFTFTGTASPAISALAAGVPAVSGVQYQLNSTTGTWTSASVSGDANNWSAPVTLKTGSNTFYVRAVAGTVTGATVSTALTYSPSAPAPVVTAPANGGRVSTTTPVSITGTAGKSTGGLSITSVNVGLRVNGSGSPWTWYTASGTSSWSYKATLSPGTYDVTAQSFIHKLASMPDLASPLAAVNTFVYAPPPTVTITSPSAPVTGAAATATDVNQWTFTGTAGPSNPVAAGVPAVSGILYSLNSSTGPWTSQAVSGDASNDWSVTLTLTKTGVNTFYVKAVSGTGTAAVSSAVASATVTYSPPLKAITITAPTSGQVFNGVASTTVKGAATIATGGLSVSQVQVAYNWSGSAPADTDWQTASGTSSWSITMPLLNGANQVMARAIVKASPANLVYTSAVCNFTAVCTCTVTGTVVDQYSGITVPGATATIAGISAPTNSSGVFTLTGVPYGAQTLTITATNYASANVSLSLPLNKTYNAGTISIQYVGLPGTGAVTGTVYFADGVTHVGAGVSVFDNHGDSTTTNASGVFLLVNVPVGPDRWVNASFYDGSNNQLNANKQVAILNQQVVSAGALVGSNLPPPPPFETNP